MLTAIRKNGPGGEIPTQVMSLFPVICLFRGLKLGPGNERARIAFNLVIGVLSSIEKNRFRETVVCC
jgi:hypothetical protein